MKLWYKGLFIISLSIKSFTPYKAMVIAPVVDLIGSPLASFTDLSWLNSYEKLPIAASKGSGACPRIHQLLYNEIVNVIEETHTEVKVETTSLFYTTAHTAIPQIAYWTHKDAFIPLSKLPDDAKDKIPQPIDFRHPTTSQTVISLYLPFKDPKSNITYSAGTRFILEKELPHAYSVYYYNPSEHAFITMRLPKSSCINSLTSMTPSEQRALMIKIARSWAHLPRGIIPYVWGGCSFTQPCIRTPYTKKQLPNGTYYIERTHTNPLNGFDCAGLITRAAQLAHIPYFYKNTYTVTQHLQPVATFQDLAIGDIIWMAGHVMLISDIEHNLLIEARGYEDGYGRVQEIPLSSFFQGITTYEELFNAFAKGQALKRLNQAGNVSGSYPKIMIYNLVSGRIPS